MFTILIKYDVYAARSQVDVIYTDIAKAFDLVDYYWP